MYLKALGFYIQLKTDTVYCTRLSLNDITVTDIITFKRGRLYNRHIVDIKEQLSDLGYDTSDYDKAIYRSKRRIQEPVKMILFAQWINDETISETTLDGELLRDSIKGLSYFNETVYPELKRLGLVKYVREILIKDTQ
jgi:hypothetical protein